MKSISIDGQTLHGDDRFGIWVTRTLEGWTGPAPTSKGHTTIPGGRVPVPGPLTGEGRQSTVTGRLTARDEEAAHQARDRLAGLLREPGRMVVTTGGLTTYRNVRDLEMDDPVLRGRMLFWQVTVTALDSSRYGDWNPPRALPSGVMVHGIYHRGNADSFPLVTVTGTDPVGYSITHSDGTTFEVTTPLRAGQEHLVDFSTAQAYADGLPLTSYGRAQQLAIHPGQGQGLRLAPLSTGSVTGTLTVQDVWT